MLKVSLSNNYYSPMVAVKFQNFNIPANGIVYRDNGKLHFASGWTCNNNLFVYSYYPHLKRYEGEWVHVDNLPEFLHDYVLSQCECD